MSSLESAAGGAAVGFSVAGPWGAIIGGAAGGLIPALREIAGGSDDVAGSMKAAKPIARDFASTLDEVTAASTKATGALALQALQERGSLDQGIALGLSQRTLVNATLGRKGALDTVRAAIDKYSNSEILATSASEAAVGAAGGFRPVYSDAAKATQKQAAAAEGLSNSLGVLTPQLRDQTRKTREQIAATADYTGKLKGLPKEVVTAIKQNGVEPSVRAIADLVKRYDLARKDVKTLIAATGIDATVRQVQRVIDRLSQVRDKTVTVTVATVHASATAHGIGAAGGVDGKTAGKTAGESLGKGVALGLLSQRKTIGDAVEKTAKDAGKKLKEQIQRVRDSLATARSDFASLVEPITSNFTQGLFDFDTAGAFSANLATVKGTLTTLIGNFKTLIAEGLKPAFLYQLFQSGGPALINSLAGLPKDEALATGGLFSDVMSLSDQLGTAVAGATDKGAALENQTRRLEAKLDKLIKHVDNGADRTGDAVNGAASNGHRRAKSNGGRRAA